MIFAYLEVSVLLFILARYDLCKTDGSMIFAYPALQFRSWLVSNLYYNLPA
jgi:hypothetical protein